LKRSIFSFAVAALVIIAAVQTDATPKPAHSPYPWLDHPTADTIDARYPAPKGYVRDDAQKGGFGEWLRGLPLLEGRPKVLLFDGREKNRQDVHDAVVDMDVGNRDLQQCADAVMRLRAEYLLFAGKPNQISFRFTNGSSAKWTDWQRGFRPRISGNKTKWVQTAKPSSGYRTFRQYLTKVFQYAGTASLSKELKDVPGTAPPKAGDVFIKGGFPGHAVIVVDTAHNAAGEHLFLIAQGYMPAQQVHILKNPNDEKLSPWYRFVPDAPLRTPEWRFDAGTLKRF